MAGKSPPLTKTAQAQARDDRLKAALKANLGRRKAQARARAEDHIKDQTVVSTKNTGKKEE